PTNSNTPPRKRARSPVQYIRPPPKEKGSATNRSAVNPGRPRYPRANRTPDKYKPPTTPSGTGRKNPSSTYTRVFHTGRPIGTPPRPTPSEASNQVTSTAASVGPYKLTKATPGNDAKNSSATSEGNASPEANTRWSPWHRPATGSATKARNIEGTK